MVCSGSNVVLYGALFAIVLEGHERLELLTVGVVLLVEVLEKKDFGTNSDRGAG